MRSYEKMYKKIPVTEAKIEALSMFLQGVKLEVIAKNLRKHRNTITNWRYKYDWDDHLRRLEEEARKRESESNTQRRVRMLKLSKIIQAKFAKDIDEQDVNAGSAIKAMEFEARLCGMDVQKIQVSTDTKTDWIDELNNDDIAKEGLPGAMEKKGSKKTS